MTRRRIAGLLALPLTTTGLPDDARSGNGSRSGNDVSAFNQMELVPNRFGTSDFLWQWGQFLDHDIDLTEGVDPPEPADVSSDPEVQARLAAAYAGVDEIDLWVGCLAEDPMPESQVGPLAHAILVDQFTALRDGDRLWYERALPPGDPDRVRSTRLSDVIRRNTGIGTEIPDDGFRVVEGRDPLVVRDRDRRSGRRRAR